jgi:hypothetical protein
MPTGAVTFTDGQTSLGSAPLNASGVATYTTSSLAIGDHSIVARYAGDSDNAPSESAALAQTVSAQATTTALAASANPVKAGHAVTYTASTRATSGTGSPTGAVTFYDGSTPISCGQGSRAFGGGSATCVVTYSGRGTHSITATYSGDAGFAPSTSSALVETVKGGSAPSSTGGTTTNSPAGAPLDPVLTLSATMPEASNLTTLR